MIFHLLDISALLLMVICILCSIRNNNPLRDVIQLTNMVCVGMITFAFFSVTTYLLKFSASENTIHNLLLFVLCFAIAYICYFMWSKWRGETLPIKSNIKSTTRSIICLFLGCCKWFVISIIIYAASLSIAPPLYIQWPPILLNNIQKSYIFPMIDNTYQYATCSSGHPSATAKSRCYQEHRESLRLFPNQK